MTDKVPNIFTSREPRNPGEIKTCIQMLEDNPIWNTRQSRLKTNDIVKIWEKILIEGAGHLQIIENRTYDKVLARASTERKHPQYAHSFWCCIFSVFITHDVVRKMIARADLADANMFVLELIAQYFADPSQPCPVTTKCIQPVDGCPDVGIYSYNFFVFHSELSFKSVKLILDAQKFTKRTSDSLFLLFRGTRHDVFIIDTYSEFLKAAFLSAGNQLLRQYAIHDGPNSTKKYLFCLTRNADIAKSLNIQRPERVSIEKKIGNHYGVLFDPIPERMAKLTEDEQKLCYLVALGYMPEHVQAALRINHDTYQRWQPSAFDRLFNAGYHNLDRCKREVLQQVIREHMHEVRSVTCPLYPWPEDLPSLPVG